MSGTATIEERISRSYASLSDKLQVAADYVAENPIDIATRSLRSLATTSGVSPATFSRLARALGYADYEQMREDGRQAMGRKMESFSERAHALRQSKTPSDAALFLNRQASACIANIEILERDTDRATLEAAVVTLHKAKHVHLIGAQGSAGFADYFGYLAHWFKPNWTVAEQNGRGLGGTLARLERGDAVLAISKAPYAHRTIAALRSVYEQNVPAIVITDSHTSPALQFAAHGFVVPTESPQFFSSYAATLVLIETIITLLLSRAGEDAEDMIRATEHQIHALGETWTP